MCGEKMNFMLLLIFFVRILKFVVVKECYYLVLCKLYIDIPALCACFCLFFLKSNELYVCQVEDRQK